MVAVTIDAAPRIGWARLQRLLNPYYSYFKGHHMTDRYTQARLAECQTDFERQNVLAMIRSENRPESITTLEVVARAFGWHGGTIHQAKQRAAVASPAELDKVCSHLVRQLPHLTDPETAAWFMAHRRETHRLAVTGVESIFDQSWRTNRD